MGFKRLLLIGTDQAHENRCTRLLVCLLFLAPCYHLVSSQSSLTCDSVSSDTTNVFTTYNISVSGSDDYTLTYDPVEYGPGKRMPLGTRQVTATANMTSSTMNVIGSCVFNVTVSLDSLPIACPVPAAITVETDPGQPTHTYQFQPINVTYQPESVTYESYGPITMYLTFDGDANNRDPALTVGRHTTRIYFSDGNLTADCGFASIDVEDREPPVVICPDDIFATTPGVINFLPKNLTDNADPNPTFGVIPFYGTPFELGVTLVTFIADDVSENEANCTFTVTIDNKTQTTTVSLDEEGTTAAPHQDRTTESQDGTTRNRQSSQADEGATAAQTTTASVAEDGTTESQDKTARNRQSSQGAVIALSVLLCLVSVLAVLIAILYIRLRMSHTKLKASMDKLKADAHPYACLDNAAATESQYQEMNLGPGWRGEREKIAVYDVLTPPSQTGSRLQEKGRVDQKGIVYETAVQKV